ncbi:hypothetical protein J4E89_005743 [Alternaria sp. Ai002NY15]|nr:hypothetical protein J4E89_005743 [Alternaria sp. Ai002NY15]
MSDRLKVSQACAQEEHALLYLNLAERAFSLLDAHTKKFPLGMQRYKQDDLRKGNWGVRLTLKHNKSDNGMDVGPYFFVLAEARKKHDEEEQRMM